MARSGHATLKAHMAYARSRGATPRRVDNSKKPPPSRNKQGRTNQRAGGPNAYDQGSYVGGYN